ncbi:polyprenyl synthetase family protein [Saccharomonospora sp.]|uniref:polyprenyl synthetase family protein n=1 Tax=Saccharomonospora sp. TaxID=33913 RepID=UPI0026339771|nr:polyprenyl synthetase family protein [Saccharomonospora sp.]
MTATLPSEVNAAQQLVQPALREAVATLTPAMRRIASYHLGWTDEYGDAVDGDGGKALRPTLALLAARAVGAPPESALPGAVAVELVHNFSLLHDDVMDGDTERRHRPTAWRLFGTPAAILAGDALLTLAVEVLDSVGKRSASRRLTAAVHRLIEGQSADIEYESRILVSVEECLHMEDGKTASLMACAAELGALLGGADDRAVAALGDFGRNLGMGFQLVDDLLGILGSPETTGKPVLADLRVRKKSVPVVAALNSDTDSASALREFYRRERPPSDADVRTMAALIEDTGAITWTRDRAHRYIAAAESSLATVNPPEDIHAALADLTRFVVERDR